MSSTYDPRGDVPMDDHRYVQERTAAAKRVSDVEAEREALKAEVERLSAIVTGDAEERLESEVEALKASCDAARSALRQCCSAVVADPSEDDIKRTVEHVEKFQVWASKQANESSAARSALQVALDALEVADSADDALRVERTARAAIAVVKKALGVKT